MLKNLFHFGSPKELCNVCGKQVFVNEKLTYDSKIYHNSCFRCKKCNCRITPTTMGKLGEDYYCSTHMLEEFKIRGHYDNVKEKDQIVVNSPTININIDSKKKEEKKKSVEKIDPENTKDWLILDKIPLNSKYIIEKNENGKVTITQMFGDSTVEQDSNSLEEGLFTRKRFGTVVARKKSAPRLLELNESDEDITPKGSPNLRKNFLTKGVDSPKNEPLRKSSLSVPELKQERRLSITDRLTLLSKKEPLKNRIFGVDYEVLMEKETGKCPKIVIQLIDELLEQKAQDVEGIFRVSGTQGDIDEILQQIDKGKEIEWKSIKDIHTMSGLLKLYFRSLPIPLLTYDLYSDFIKINTIETDKEKIEHIKKVLNTLSPSRRFCFGKLLNLLDVIQKNSKVNMMNTNNLSVIFSFNLVREKEEDVNTLLISQQRIAKSFEDLLNLYEFYQEIFVDEDEKK